MKVATWQLNADQEINRAHSLAWRTGKPGLSMVEMGIALLVIVTFIALALGGAQRVLGQSGVTEEATNIAMLSSAVRSTRTGAGYNTATGGIIADLEAINGIPTNMAYDRTNDALSNRWTGAVTFTSLDSGANFSITYAGMPTDECSQLLMTVKAGVLRSVGAGATPSTWTNIGDITASSAATMCSSGIVSWSSAEA